MKHVAITLSLSLAAASGFASSAHADLMYVQTMGMGGMSMGGGVAVKSYYQGKSRRIESGGFGAKTIMLMTAGSSSVTRINPELKIYTTEMPALRTPGKAPAGRPSPGAGASQIKSIAINVKDLGATKVDGKPAHHWKISNTMQMKNGRSIPSQMEIWSGTTPIPTSPGETTQALSRLPQLQGLDPKVKVSGDVKAMSKATATVPLKMVVYFGERPMGELKTTTISTKPLSPSLFKPPAGYKKVSAAQFDEAGMKAMQAKISEMMKQMGKMSGGMPKGMQGMPKGMPHMGR